MKDYLKGLNENQLKAINTLNNNVLVHASAGSGKTRTLTARYMRLTDELGVSPDSILCVTFTNKAANEMKARIRKRLGDMDLGFICTFHGLCVRILREDGSFFGYPTDFSIVDSEDSDYILSEIFRRFGITSRKLTHKKARDYIHAFRTERYPEEYYRIMTETDMTHLNSLRQKHKGTEDLLFKVACEYFYELRKISGLDFEDLLLIAVHLLMSSREARMRWQRRFAFIMTDEYQDVSPSQVDLLRILTDYHKRLFAVGDPDQTIYEFRGADVEFILNFEEEFEPCTTIKMSTNYRSGQKILDVANNLIRHNRNRLENDMVSGRKTSGQVSYYHAKTEKEEFDWISKKIENLHDFQNVNYSDIAVLFRNGDLSRGVEESFRRNGDIPYVMLSGIEFYRRKEVKDVLAYLRLCSRDDDLAFLRIVNEPKRGLGRKKLDHVKAYAEEHGVSLFRALEATCEDDVLRRNGGTAGAKRFIEMILSLRSRSEGYLSGFVQDVLDASGYESYLREAGDTDRLDNLSSLKQSVKEFEAEAGEEVALADYLDHVSLYTDADEETRRNSVKLMTVHASKGLEFPYVFICGMTEGVFPSRKCTTPESMEEERRVAYVAFTRAMDELFLTDSEGRNYEGMFKYPSRFIFDAGGEDNIEFLAVLPEHLKAQSSELTERESRSRRNAGELCAGDRVSHELFGEGTVVSMTREDIEVQFDRDRTPVRLMLRAPLTRLSSQ